MKKKLFLIVATLLIGISACKKEIRENPSVGNTYQLSSNRENCDYLYSTTVDSVGLIHNLGCDAAFSYLQNGIENGTIDTADAEVLLTGLSNSLMTWYSISEVNYITNNISTVENANNDAFSNINQTTSFVLSNNPNNYTLWTPNVDSILSDSVKGYLNALANIYQDTSKSFAEAIQLMEDLKLDIKCSELSDYDKFVVLSGISVGINSMNYWSDHLSSWESLFGSELGLKSNQDGGRGNQKVRNVGAMDIAGAVGGGVTWGVAALFGGPAGVAVAFGAIIGGGIGSSVTMAVYYLVGGS